MNKAWCVGALCALVGAGCAGAAVQPARQLEAGEVLLSAGVTLGTPMIAGQGQIAWGFEHGDAALNATIGLMPPKAGASLRLYASEWLMVGGQAEVQLPAVNTPPDPSDAGEYCDGYGTDAVYLGYGRLMTNAAKAKGVYVGFLVGGAWRQGAATVEEVDEYQGGSYASCETMFYGERFNFLGRGGRFIFGYSFDVSSLKGIGDKPAGDFVQLEVMIPVWNHVNVKGMNGKTASEDELLDDMWGLRGGLGMAVFQNLFTVTFHHSLL